MATTSLNLFLQVSRAAVEGYTGESEPPFTCIVMTPKDTIYSNLHFNVTLNGTQSSNGRIKIRRLMERNLKDRLSTPRSQGQ